MWSVEVFVNWHCQEHSRGHAETTMYFRHDLSQATIPNEMQLPCNSCSGGPPTGIFRRTSKGTGLAQKASHLMFISKLCCCHHSTDLSPIHFLLPKNRIFVVIWTHFQWLCSIDNSAFPIRTWAPKGKEIFLSFHLYPRIWYIMKCPVVADLTDESTRVMKVSAWCPPTIQSLSQAALEQKLCMGSRDTDLLTDLSEKKKKRTKYKSWE